MDDGNGVETIPRVDDDFWLDFCRPLCKYILAEDRKWPEVTAWGKARKINGFILRNALAWLEEKKYVETYLPEPVELSRTGAWVWRCQDVELSTTYTKEPTRDETYLPNPPR